MLKLKNRIDFNKLKKLFLFDIYIYFREDWNIEYKITGSCYIRSI